MSMSDRLRQGRAEGAPRRAAFDATREARAAELLSANRGRAPIQPAPAAGKVAAAFLRPLLPERGLGLTELKRRWREIAGDGVAKVCGPEKLAAGVLTIRAPSAVAPFLQHQAPLILDRLKLAGASVKSIKIEQGAPVRAPANVARIRRKLSPAEEKALAQAVDHIEDRTLQSALLRLSRAVARG
jgi:hypothetical protein